MYLFILRGRLKEKIALDLDKLIFNLDSLLKVLAMSLICLAVTFCEKVECNLQSNK